MLIIKIDVSHDNLILWCFIANTHVKTKTVSFCSILVK